jgi:hypothetical protein
MSFWADAYKTSDGRYRLIPYMSGYGGNRLVLAPNGISSFRFTDAMNYNTYPLIRAAEAVQPFPGQGVPVGNLILLRGLWLVPKNPAFMRAIDLILSAWLLLTLVALVIYFWDVFHARIPSWRMRLFWLLAFILTGPLALLVYGLAYRQPRRDPHPEAALTTPRRALGSALMSVMGYTLGILLAGFILESYLTGSRKTLLSVLACLYGLPLAFSLLCFRLPLTFSLSGRKFFPTLARTMLAEFLSLNIGMIVYMPLSITAYNLLPLPNPATLSDLSSWLFFLSPMLLVTIAGLLAIYPIHAWMTRYGLSQWLLPVQAHKVSWWVVLVMAFASLAVLFIAFQITMAAT